MTGFDPSAKERELVAESTSWDTSNPVDAEPGDIPIVDVGPYFETGAAADLHQAADALRHASETVGFYYLVGHGVDRDLMADTFEQVRRFHSLPLDVKGRIPFTGGMGYLPVKHRLLPRRATGNENEAFIIKGDASIGLDDNQWLDEDAVPGFRAAATAYLAAVRSLALRLLPVYAVALDLKPDFFASGFQHPFWRLRFTHYPPGDPSDGQSFGSYGIAPHVDTTFFTLLAQDSRGLTIHSAKRDQWIHAPVVENAYVVNSGELLRTWSNDRFLSTRHFANNPSATSPRYSIPFFFNATADWPMECLPSCHGPGNPPKYPTISYLQSQAAVQGE